MKINITYAASVANAPAGYKAAVQAAVAIYEGLIQDPITVNITFGYGDVGSQPVPDSAIGVSTSDHGYALTYTELRSALGEAATSVQDVAAAMALTPYDMTDGGVFYIPSAQAKALGLIQPDSARNDGFVGLSTKLPMNFSTTQRAVSGQYDAVGIFLHEIGHVLGRVSYQGYEQSDGSSLFAALDLYRGNGSGGAHDPVNGRSLVSGLTFPIYGTLNDPSNGGTNSDWGPSMFGDAYNAFGSLGVKTDISTSGLQLVDILGYDVRARPVAAVVQPTGPLSSTAITVQGNALYTVPFSPSLYIKDAASPTSGYLRLNAVAGQPSPTLILAGQTVLEASTGDLNGIVASGAGVSAASVYGTGSLWVRALNGDAHGLLALGPVEVSSAGAGVQVVADHGEATGFAAQGSGSLILQGSGTINVFGVGRAVGVANASFLNSSFIRAVVTAAQGSLAEAIGVLDPVVFRNSGTVEARSLAAGGVSVGIEVTGANLAGLANHTLTYENTGTITGEYAFLENPSAPLPTDYKARIINSNAMIGDIAVGSVASEIVNTGVIAGDILFGDGDNSYDGTAGLFIGDLMLGNGTSRIKLGNDGESVIAERGTVDLIGGAGVDTLSYVLSSVGVTIDLRTTTAQTVASGAMLTVRGVENLTGSGGADRLTGDAGANRFYDRFGGDDVFVGGGGNDLLWVERYTTTPTSSVSLDGGDGDDRLIARGLAAATLVGGAGNDQVVVDATGGSYQITLGAGSDTLFLASTGPVSSSIVVTDFAPDDRLDFDLFLDDALTNHTDGADPFASGHLRLVQSGADTLLQVDANGGGDSFSTLVTLRNTAAGSLFPSDLEGFVSNIYAGAAQPGTSGADALVAQPGRNALQGLGGDDTLTGGAGPDFLDGGEGLDTAVYRGLSRAYALSLDGQGGGKVSGGPEGGVDGLSEVERLKFVDGYLSISTADTTAQVYRIYVAALGRTPDAPGLGSWVRVMEGGATLSAVAAGFLGSPEFNARFGGSTTSDNQFVTLLYANVLHRQPDAGGMNTWLNFLSNGHSRAETVIGFSESSENIRNTAPSIQQGLWVGDPNAGVAARLYDTVFGRLPDAPGLTDWTRALNTGTSLTQVAAGFVNAPEFQSTYGALNDAAFVNLLYQNVLHRQPDQPGLASWTGLLAQGQSRADVVIGFSESAEHIRLTAPQIDNGVWFA